LGKRLFKQEPVSAANIAMIAVLLLTAAASYIKELSLMAIFLLNISAVLVYLIVTAASKFIKKH
jgi:hypothetical protein